MFWKLRNGKLTFLSETVIDLIIKTQSSISLIYVGNNAGKGCDCL